MNRSDVKKIVDKLAIDIESIADKKIRTIQETLLNLIECLVEENEALKKENQQLKDEINRLKGEQGQPPFSKKKANQNFSSENDRKRKKKKGKKPKQKKRSEIKIDREVILDIESSDLPADVIFKGYQDNIVQDIIIKTDNVKFKKAIYYSPSQNKTYIAKVPLGYEGEFGPNIKSLVFSLSYDSLISQPALRRWFETFSISIAASTLSRMLTQGENIEQLHQEKQAIVTAGLQSTSHQQLDDTTTKVNGKNHYTHILCNDFYTAYTTKPKKNRLTVLYILSQGQLNFRLNDEAYLFMESLKLPEKWITALKHHKTQESYTKKELNHLLKKLYPNPKTYKSYKRIIIESAAIAGFHEKETWLKTLICDDAPQFKLLLDIGLCWIHEGRHYKKLNPVIEKHVNLLNAFQNQFWDYYHTLLDYKQAPSREKANALTTEFEQLFSPTTGYDKLDECIKRSREKKDSLLLVLQRPAIPLHNNPPELGARSVKRKGDVSLQTKNAKGTKAKDTLLTITETAKKLHVNVFKYFYDRNTKKFQMPSLADLIKIKSSQSDLITDTS